VKILVTDLKERDQVEDVGANGNGGYVKAKEIEFEIIGRPRKRWRTNFILRIKEEETHLTLLVHDDDDDNDDDDRI
jgi:hypothetical protein